MKEDQLASAEFDFQHWQYDAITKKNGIMEGLITKVLMALPDDVRHRAATMDGIHPSLLHPGEAVQICPLFSHARTIIVHYLMKDTARTRASTPAPTHALSSTKTTVSISSTTPPSYQRGRSPSLSQKMRSRGQRTVLWTPTRSKESVRVKRSHQEEPSEPQAEVDADQRQMEIRVRQKELAHKHCFVHLD